MDSSIRESIEEVAVAEFPIDEKFVIHKHRLMPDQLCGDEKRICVVTGIHGDELEGQYVCYALTKMIRENPQALKVATYFGLQGESTVTIAANGSGIVLVDGMKLPSTNYQGKFFTDVDMVLTAIPSTGRIFEKWSDGNTDNPRKVQVSNGANFTAEFK